MALGYKGYVIKDYFIRYFALHSDITVNLGTGGVKYHDSQMPDWNVHMIDTGEHSMTGGRLHRLQKHLSDGTFMMTYGDGVADVDIRKLVDFHRSHGKLATLTAVRPPARFGTMVFEGDQVMEFQEKPQTGEGWINGGYFVLEPQVFEYLNGDDTIFEREPLERLAADGQLVAYKHEGFWQCMDTLRDKNRLEGLWESEQAPWAVWKQPALV